jgi:hypothetical protein
MSVLYWTAPPSRFLAMGRSFFLFRALPGRQHHSHGCRLRTKAPSSLRLCHICLFATSAISLSPWISPRLIKMVRPFTKDATYSRSLHTPHLTHTRPNPGNALLDTT